MSLERGAFVAKQQERWEAINPRSPSTNKQASDISAETFFSSFFYFSMCLTALEGVANVLLVL